MKKLLSLLLALAMLLAAVPALAAPLDIAFLDSVQEWTKRFSPAEKDYEAEISTLDMSLLQGLLRQGNGITELKIDSPLLSLFDASPFSFGGSELAVLQYSEDGLALRAGGETWLVDVKAIVDFLTRDVDYSKAAVQADLALVKNLATRFVMEVLNPAISINPATGALTLHFDVDQAEIMERMPAFLESLKDQEEAIHALMIKYGAEFALAQTSYAPTLAGLQEAWAEFAAKGDALSPLHLQADAVVSAEKGEQALQVGISGVLTEGADSCLFALEHLPTKENGTLTIVTLNGIGGGQYFDYSIEITRAAGMLDIDITATETDTVLYKFNAVKEEQNIEIMAYSYVVSTNMLNELSYGWYYDPNTGELSATLDLIYGPLDNQTTQNLYTLNASIQEKGVTGTLFIGDEATWHFTWTTAPLYYRLMVSAYVDDVIREDFDLWLFPQGNNDYRYRASLRSMAGNTVLDHHLVTGTLNPDAFAMNISKAGGEMILDLNLNHQKEGDETLITGSCFFLEEKYRMNVSCELKMAGGKPISFEGDAIQTTKDGITRLNAWHLSWLPGIVTYVDGINYYTARRVQDTETELSYVITRNESVEMGSVAASLDENDRLTLNIAIDGSDFTAILGPAAEAPAEEAEVDAELPVIGLLEGTLDADGTLAGILRKSVEESGDTEEAAEPAASRIEPLDLTNATRIDVKYLIRNYFLLMQP